MSEEKLRQQVSDAFKNRAILYFLIFDELRKELGEERAEEIMKRAIYRRGVQKGEKYKPYAPGNFEGLRDAFVSGVPDDGRLFDPNVLRCDADGLDVNLENCPLKEAWEEIELGEEDRVTMCRIAGEIDKGTFEAAGFDFEPDTWQPGRTGCCHLHIRRKNA
ncbi:MAG: L-2-amino-thiazoline-4-carboxylic acid hydrolase [Planctomycetes bacterium]|nr:L-2-amino-thiazoline-4-carboxylic acid hydrolase [Planctomycetota bacterium]MBL7042759.1 L-2-amino-thiazoline-4-carboxylic acid hydrolase [Pirellulaceae bacterium]